VGGLMHSPDRDQDSNVPDPRTAIQCYPDPDIDLPWIQTQNCGRHNNGLCCTGSVCGL
jgi:hypothetical protein